MHTKQKTFGVVLIAIGIALLIVLVLLKAEFDEQAVFLCEAVEADPALEMAECPAHTSNTPWLLMLGFGAAVLITGAGIGLFLLPPLAGPRPVKKSDIDKLDKEERQIYDLLKQREGSMYQSDLIKETGFSKVKITRILDKMEGKQFVTRQRRGMTNIIVLK